MAGEEEPVKSWEEEEDQWELCNDDGFVYKRRKTSNTEEISTVAGGSDLDSEAEVRRRKRNQRKKTLLKLKDQYAREIFQWENVSNTLRGMEKSSQIHHQNQQLDQEQKLEPSSSVMNQTEKTTEASIGTLIGDLLLQVETQEAMIQDISDLCDAADTIFKVEDDFFKQSFIDLPIWASSPRNLLASLSHQDDCNSNGDNVQITSL